MSLMQSITSFTTIFAFMIYTLCILIALPFFEKIHEKLEHHFLQFAWDRVGMPVLRTCLLLLFLFLVYPLNFGITEAPALTEVINVDSGRLDLIFNLLFIVTFVYPVIPIIGKADALMIPLQGIVASILLFRWLCELLLLQHYTLLPSAMSIFAIVFISIIGYFVARFVSEHAGEWLDHITHREGYQILIFQAVLMILQSPIIFIYGHAIGEQLIR